MPPVSEQATHVGNVRSRLTFWSPRPTVGYRIRLWLALAFILWATCPRGPAQIYWKYAAAGRHAPRVLRALKPHPEFADVEVWFSTSDGSLSVSGKLPRADLQQRLQALVESTHPRMRVRYHLHVVNARSGKIERLPTRTVEPQ